MVDIPPGTQPHFMPPVVRDQVLGGEVLERLACLPNREMARATAIEVAVVLLAHDLFVEIDTYEGRGYALIDSQERMCAVTGLGDKRLRSGLRHLCEVGMLVKTAGVSLGERSGTSSDWYWLTTIRGAFVPPAQPKRFASRRNGRMHLSTGQSASGQNDRMHNGNPLVDAAATAGAIRPERRDVVVCSSQPTPSGKNSTNKQHEPADAADAGGSSSVAQLDSYRPVTRTDGAPIEDPALRQALVDAGFKGRLDPAVQEAFDIAGVISAEYVTEVSARGKGPGWIVTALRASGASAIWDHFDDHNLTADLDEDRGGPRVWQTKHCGICEPTSRTWIIPDDPYSPPRRCHRCHDDFLAEQDANAAHLQRQLTPSSAQLAHAVGEPPF